MLTSSCSYNYVQKTAAGLTGRGGGGEGSGYVVVIG